MILGMELKQFIASSSSRAKKRKMVMMMF